MERSDTTIYSSPELRAQWPGVARIWARRYPRLFDPDDLRLVLHQPQYHFSEWFTAIHLFHRDGALSLIEKYAYSNHARKRAVLARVLTADRLEFLDTMVATEKVQPPDLFVVTPDGGFRFAEAKGPGDRLSPRQIYGHAVISERFRVPVEILRVRVRELDAA